MIWASETYRLFRRRRALLCCGRRERQVVQSMYRVLRTFAGLRARDARTKSDFTTSPCLVSRTGVHVLVSV